MFHEGDLQSGIGLAVQQSKAVLCFVCDDAPQSEEWEDILNGSEIQERILRDFIALRLKAGSQEAGFLGGICPIDSTPAVIIIRNAQVEHNLQANKYNLEELQTKLRRAFALGIGDEDDEDHGRDSRHAKSEPQQETEQAREPGPSGVSENGHATPSAGLGYIVLPPSAGRMRLPNNAYEALQARTQELVAEDLRPAEILDAQLTMLERIPVLKAVAQSIRSNSDQHSPSLPDEVCERLLKLPGAVIRRQVAKPLPASQSNTAASSAEPRSAQALPSTTTSPDSNRISAPSSQTSKSKAPATTSTPSLTSPQSAEQEAQRADYIKMQRSREQTQRDERERIKSQIKADREERRRLDALRKQGTSSTTSTSTSDPVTQTTKTSSSTSEVRLQIRTFDGSTLRQNFAPTSNITSDVRPWIDSSIPNTIPYTLKLILTPLPNRNIEAAEEEQGLFDLGIRGSCTMVMVPVKGFVESYTGSTPGGVVGSAVSGGYNLFSGAVGGLFGGVRSILGYGIEQGQVEGQGHQHGGSVPEPSSNANTNQAKARVRTLADQRAEEAKRDQQFYNGNQLNFEPNRDEDRKDD